MTPPLDLEALERLAEVATPPPWRWDARSVSVDDAGNEKPCGNIYAERDGEQVPIIVTDGGYYPPTVPDGAFILAAREALPALLRIARAAAVARRHQREGHDHDCSYRAPGVDREHPSGYVCLDALDDALEGRER